MADNDLLIKINADAKNAEKAFDDVRAKTEALEGQLNNVAKISAVGFAALTAELGLATHAALEAERASNSLINALQSQGIAAQKVTVTNEDGTQAVLGIVDAYKQYAAEIQDKTGLDDDELIASQAKIQGYLGQTKVTKELTQAIADFSVGQKVSLETAADLIGKTIGSTTNAFSRYGLQLSTTATQSEKMAAVLEFVNGKFNGQAEAANKGLGGIKGLSAAFSDFQQAIGERFAPLLSSVFSNLTKFFALITRSPEVVNLASSFLAAGLAVTALGTAIPALASAFLVLRAALAAAQVSLTATQFAVRGLIGATGIGLLVIAVTEVALHWNAIFPRLQAVAQGFVTSVAGSFSGLGKIIEGALKFDGAKLTEGFNELKASISKGIGEATKELPKQTEGAVIEQNKILADGAAKRQAQQEKEQARLLALRNAENELIKLQLTNASQAAIDIKQKEIETLKKLTEQNTADTVELLDARYEQLKAQEDDQRAQDLERTAEFEALKDETKQELDLTRQAYNEQLRTQELQAIQAQLLTESEIEKKIYADRLKEQIKAQNKFVEEQKKYGVVVAALDQVIGSTQIQAAKAVGNELVALSQSKNATLKAIGKVAAISNITIATAESAVTIAQKVIQALPFPINIPIAAALSGARIAFGAEQIANVSAAQSGALVEGGIPGRDSVPFLLEPGELVAPRRNFEEVVTGVQAVRNGGLLGGDEALTVLQSIDQKLTQPSQYIIQGDVLADQTFIDTLIDKINDRLRYGNARLAINGA